MVGTVDYIAPEVFEKEGYTETVDFWSLGTILFEMLLGYPPFCGKTPSATLNNVLQFEKNFKIPSEPPLTPEAVDLMRRLITKPEKRLGLHGVQEIKAHPFFRGVNWAEIRRRPAPIVPKLSSEEDTRNFEKFEMSAPWTPVFNHNGVAGRSEGMLFIGYTYKKPQTLDAHKEIDEIFERLKQKKESEGRRNFSEDRLVSHYGDKDASGKIGSNSRLGDNDARQPYNFSKKPRANEYTDKSVRPKLADFPTRHVTQAAEEAPLKILKSEFKKLPLGNASTKLLEKIKMSGRDPESSKMVVKSAKPLLGPSQKPFGQLQALSITPLQSAIKKPTPLLDLNLKSKIGSVFAKPQSVQAGQKSLTVTSKPISAHPLEAPKQRVVLKPPEKPTPKVTPAFLKSGLLGSSKKNT